MVGIPDDNGPMYVSPNQQHYEHRLDVLLKQRFEAIADRALAEGRELMELLAEARAERDAYRAKVAEARALMEGRHWTTCDGERVVSVDDLRATLGDA